jgi:NADH-quinone oxidoreductase subunit A
MMASMLSPLAGVIVQGSDARNSWEPIVLLLVMGIGFAVTTILLSVMIGPSRTGSVKEGAYESGMMPIGDARQRFNVRFYVVAMIFLVFDVEIVFLYPWATIFAPALQGQVPLNNAASAAVSAGGGVGGGTLLIEMFIFIGILLLAYFYALGKGVFRWD